MSSKPIVVVTGGAGFIGSHMVNLLINQGYAVRVIDNMVGGREENLAQHQNNPDLVIEQRDIRSYAPNDSVSYSGGYYLAIKASINHVPTDVTYWAVN